MYISYPRSRISYFSKELALFFNDTYYYLTLYYIFTGVPVHKICSLQGGEGIPQSGLHPLTVRELSAAASG